MDILKYQYFFKNLQIREEQIKSWQKTWANFKEVSLEHVNRLINFNALTVKFTQPTKVANYQVDNRAHC